MRTVIQRVNQASIFVSKKKINEINKGLLVFVAIETGDESLEIKWMVDKLIHLRIFDDGNGKMNKSIQDVDGEILAVSQFTLYGDCSKGRRPSFIKSAPLDLAKKTYDEFINFLKNKYSKVKTGIFQENMQIELVNDGPVTFIVDSKK